MFFILRRGVPAMTNPLKRGSAPDRAQPVHLRPGSFKPGHKKHGGRRRGTPNKFSGEYKNDIFEAAYRVGEDANGKAGMVGYLRWVARHHPKAFGRLLGSVMKLQELEIGMPEKPLPTVEEHDEEVRAYFGLCSDERTQPEPAEPRSATAPTRHKDRTPRQTKRARPKRSNSKARRQKRPQPPDPESPWAWTGQDAPVGPLMHLAIVRPKEFCALLQATLPRPTAWQRGCAERRAWEESLRLEEQERVRKKSRTQGRVEENRCHNKK
jgi:hypothetical protein